LLRERLLMRASARGRFTMPRRLYCALRRHATPMLRLIALPRCRRHYADFTPFSSCHATPLSPPMLIRHFMLPIDIDS
jgi:hypothetical protein